MRKRNWHKYNKALTQRGSLTFLIDPKTIKSLKPKTKKDRGRPLEFSDQLIVILLIMKIHYKMPYRMLEGVAWIRSGTYKGRFQKLSIFRG